MAGGRELSFLRPALSVVGLAAVATLAWFVAPLLLPDSGPLRPDVARWLAAALVLGVAALRAVWRGARAARRNRALMDGLVAGDRRGARDRRAAGSSSAGDDTEAGAREVEVLGQRFEAAIKRLRRSRAGGRGGLRAALAGQPYIYQLPWYVIIGAPGAGKTTALVHSGLEFPLAAELGQARVRGIGGTRNCDWWFSSEAVLIDTAGRYTTHDSEPETDRAAWLGFVGLLARHRPRRPLNGVLLTVSVGELLSAAAPARLAHAVELRRRVDELQRLLGIRLPLYLLVTKTDLLAGFTEFFADFDPEQRAQVWGVTFPHGARRSDDPLARMESDFAALEKRLHECMIERLRAERDRDRRSAIHAFPQQWRLLREALVEFVQTAFARDPDGVAPLVRGVYFTSATQEGLPMDRALGQLARALGLGGRVLAPARPSAKAFFITRLLRDVVFAEAGLAGSHRGAVRRRRLLEWGLAGVCGVTLAGAAALSWHAYAASRDAAAALGARMPALQREVAAARQGGQTDLGALLPVLESLRQLKAPRPAAGGPPWPRMGLDRGGQLAAAADDAYRGVLRDAFLPRIAARLEERMREARPDRVERIYEALRAYLMLFSGEHFDAAALRGYLGADWDATLPPSLGRSEREALHHHLERLLEGGEVGAPSQADPALIDSTRRLVAAVPQAQRAYGRLQQSEFGPEVSAGFSAETVAGPAARRVFVRASGRPLADGVPGLYSRTVYTQAFRERARQVLRQLDGEQAWVLGGAAGAARPDGALLAEVERLYLADYARRWDAYVQDLRLAAPATLAQSAELAQALARPDSPLPALLRAVVRDTSIEAPPGQLPAEAAQRFEALRRFVDGRPAPVDEMQAALGRLASQLTAVQEAARQRALPAAGDATRELAALAARAPQPVQAMLAQLAAASATQAFAALREPLARQLASEVGAPCQEAVAGRYPLARAGREEISRDAFVRTFAAGGLIDGFYQRHLAAHADSATPAALEPFRRAQAIRNAFFRDGRVLAVRLEWRLLELDPAIAEFALDVDGQLVRFRRDTRTAFSVQWPGPTDARRVQLQVTPAAGGAPSSFVFEGPWALFRLFDRVRVEPDGADRVQLVFDVEGRKARFELRHAGALALRHELEQFQCPRQL